MYTLTVYFSERQYEYHLHNSANWQTDRANVCEFKTSLAEVNTKKVKTIFNYIAARYLQCSLVTNAIIFTENEVQNNLNFLLFAKDEPHYGMCMATKAYYTQNLNVSIQIPLNSFSFQSVHNILWQW